MPKLNRYASVALLCALAAACGDDDDDGLGPDPTNGTMTASIDGSAWNAGLTVAATYQGNTFGIGGTDGTRQITIAVTDVTGTGTFDFGLGEAGAAIIAQGSESWTTTLTGGSGTLTISSINATGASGTFSFTAMPTPGSGATSNRVVTNGTFSVTF
jgi:hypothetical protein